MLSEKEGRNFVFYTKSSMAVRSGDLMLSEKEEISCVFYAQSNMMVMSEGTNVV